MSAFDKDKKRKGGNHAPTPQKYTNTFPKMSIKGTVNGHIKTGI